MKILLTPFEVGSHTVLHSFFVVLAKYLRSTLSATQIGSLASLSQVSPFSPILFFLFSCRGGDPERGPDDGGGAALHHGGAQEGHAQAQEAQDPRKEQGRTDGPERDRSEIAYVVTVTVFKGEKALPRLCEYEMHLLHAGRKPCSTGYSILAFTWS